MLSAVRVCPISPSPPYSGERGWGEGAWLPRPKPLTPTPLPGVPGRGERLMGQSLSVCPKRVQNVKNGDENSTISQFGDR
jgi:hypothetical protein